MAEKPKPIPVGVMECHYCNHDVTVKIAKGGHVTATCDHTQGGCGYQHHGRFARNDELVLKRITRWLDNEPAKQLRAKLEESGSLPRRRSSKPAAKPAAKPAGSRGSSVSPKAPTTPEEPAADPLTKALRWLGLE